MYLKMNYTLNNIDIINFIKSLNKNHNHLVNKYDLKIRNISTNIVNEDLLDMIDTILNNRDLKGLKTVLSVHNPDINELEFSTLHNGKRVITTIYKSGFVSINPATIDIIPILSLITSVTMNILEVADPD